MTNEEIFILELYDEYNSTLEMLREDCENARRVLAVLDEYGEDVSELLVPVMVETNDLLRFCNRMRCFMNIKPSNSAERTD